MTLWKFLHVALIAKTVLRTRKNVKVASKLVENPIILKNMERMFAPFGSAQQSFKLSIVDYAKISLVSYFWSGMTMREA